MVSSIYHLSPTRPQLNTAKISYRDIKADLLARIRDGIWLPGSLVPNEADLAAEFGCARATVNRAMRELAEDGLLQRKRKAGTRVNTNPVRNATFSIPLIRAEIEETGARYRYSLVHRDVLPAPDWLRARLDLAAYDSVLHLGCMHDADGKPFQYEDRWINIGAVPTVTEVDFRTTGPNEWLLNTVPYTDVELRFYASNADTDLAALLMITPGEAVFVAERTTRLDGVSVTFARLSFGRGYSMTTRF